MKLALIAMSVPALALADDEIALGSIVKIEAQKTYVNNGVDKDVMDGAALRLERPIALRHPLNPTTVQDWIPFGAATVTQGGAVMSRAIVGDLVTALKVGDLAEVLVDRPDKPAPPSAPARDEAPPIDAAT